MKRVKKSIAFLLALLMLVQVPVIPGHATESADSSNLLEDLLEMESFVEDETELEVNEEVLSIAGELGENQKLLETDNQEVSEPDSESISIDEALEMEQNVKSEIGIDYTYVENTELESQKTQNILVSTNQVLEGLENIQLNVVHDGVLETIPLAKQVDNVLLFTKDYQGETGNYKLLNITYTFDGKTYEINFTEEINYDVAENEGISDETLLENTVVTTEEELTEEEVASAISGAKEIVKSEAPEVDTFSRMQMTPMAGNIVIVLDPGHGGSDPGAIFGNLQEKNLTLAIAKYAKEELEKYNGVTVYMTRDNDRYMSLNERVAYSKNAGATSFVSIHINAAGQKGSTTTANGAEVFVSAHSSYKPNSTALSNKILEELGKVGLSNRGVKLNNDDHNNGKYEDGNWKDDLAVIRGNILNGIPAILVEHGFINNPGDHAILGSEAKLKAMGEANATAIARHYGLTKKSVVTEEQKQLIRNFVIRMYQKALNRAPEAEGLEAYSAALINKSVTGASMAEEFIFSKEFKNKKLSNAQFVEVLYSTFLNRNADAAGKNNWIKALESGVSQKGVLKGFIDSAEFTNICKTYGIEKGTINITEGRDRNAEVTKFVYRCYKNILGRVPEMAGLNYQCDALNNKSVTAAELVSNFVQSPEFVGKKLSDTDYIKVMYRAFMGREYDNQGLNYWMERLNNGLSRKHVLAQFTNSSEFVNICNSYGLVRGSIKLDEARDLNSNVTMYIYRCYKLALRRTPEVSGLNYWTDIINRKTLTAEEVAKEFIFSAEFTNHKYSDTDYIKILYKVFLNREFDQSGLQYWLGKLNSGITRTDVFYGFSRSPEFQKLLRSYGL